jgi:hypothetical protein
MLGLVTFGAMVIGTCGRGGYLPHGGQKTKIKRRRSGLSVYSLRA